MTTITTTIPDNLAGKIKRNAEIALKSWSIWATSAISLAASVALTFGQDRVLAFIAGNPTLAAAGPLLSLAVVFFFRVAPQLIQTKSDRQAPVVAWLVDLIGKAVPGQQVSVPAPVVKALGLPSSLVVTPTAAAAQPPAFADTSADTADIPVPPVLATATPPPADKLARVRPSFPGLTDDQIREELGIPKPQAAIIVPPFQQPQPAPGV